MKKLFFFMMALLPTMAWAEVGDVFTVDNLKYRVTSESPKAVELTGCDVEQPTGALAIPASVNSYSVTSIGAYAFNSCTGLTSVTIPESVASIGNDAFFFCTHLASIIVETGNENYSSMDGVLFDKAGTTLILCPVGKAETAYTIPDGVTSIGNYAFARCTGLTSVTISEDVTSIGDRAFQFCSGLISIIIPDGVTSIGECAFLDCESLTSVTIPKSVTSLGWGAFGRCSQLTSIIVETENKNYSSIDGVLFDKAGTTILSYPAGKTETTYTIPDGVTRIDFGVFANHSELTSVTMPSSMKSIGIAAFESCKGLTSITIPPGVTNIEDGAFWDCPRITDVYCYADPSALNWVGSNDFIYQAFFYDKITKCHVAADKLDEFNAKWNTGNRNTDVNVTFVGDLGTYIEPIKEQTSISPTTLVAQSTTDATIENVYYNLDPNTGSGYQDGCIVIGKATDMNTIADAAPGTDAVRDNFTGIILKVGSGSGTIVIDVATAGGLKLAVRIGDGEPTYASPNTRSAISVNYDVSAETYVYIYAVDQSGQARPFGRNAAAAEGVMIYGINIAPTATVINAFTADSSKGIAVYNLAGQRTNGLTKGLNIIDGRKVWVK